MNNRVQQQTQRIYENMALLALDLFARIIAMRIDAGPPYMGRLKSSANFMVLPFFVPFVLAIGGDRPTPIDPHESGGGGRSIDLEQHCDTRWSPLQVDDGCKKTDRHILIYGGSVGSEP
jgi:hypothetical protein